jgi:hypothetical protein
MVGPRARFSNFSAAANWLCVYFSAVYCLNLGSLRSQCIMGMFRQSTFMASPKSFSLIDLPYLPVQRDYAEHAWLLRLIYQFRPQLQRNDWPHVSSFARRFRFLV